MSEMTFDVIARFNIVDCGEILSPSELIKFADSLGIYPEYPEEAYFDPDDNDGWTLSVFDNRIYLDYHLDTDTDGYYLDLDISESKMSNIKTKFAQKFGTLPYNSFKVKVLYYYNGGCCAGAMEVE